APPPAGVGQADDDGVAGLGPLHHEGVGAVGLDRAEAADARFGAGVVGVAHADRRGGQLGSEPGDAGGPGVAAVGHQAEREALFALVEKAVVAVGAERRRIVVGVGHRAGHGDAEVAAVGV